MTATATIFYVIAVIAGTPFLSVEYYLDETACREALAELPDYIFPDCIPQVVDADRLRGAKR